METTILSLIYEYSLTNEIEQIILKKPLDNIYNVENCLCNIKMYIKNDKPLKILSNMINDIDVKVLNHPAYVYQVRQDLYAVCNFTTKDYFTLNDKICYNIPLKNNVYDFVTPMFIVDGRFIEEYLVQEHGKFYLPKEVKIWRNDEIVRSTAEGFIQSYNHTMMSARGLCADPFCSLTRFNCNAMKVCSFNDKNSKNFKLIKDFVKTMSEERFSEDRLENMMKSLKIKE